MSDNDDRRICDLLKTDFEAGYTALFRKYYKSLVIYSFNRVEDLAAAEDIVQTVLFKTLRGRSLARPGINIRTYLFTAVRNGSLNHLESHKRSTPLDNIVPVTDDWDDMVVYDDQIIKELRSHLDNLPQRTREVVEGVMIYNMRYKEVAEKYSISVNTVKVLLGRGLGRIRTAMSDKNRQ